MPITLEWIADAPILLATCTGYLSVAEFTDMFEHVGEMTKGTEGRIYRIGDYRQAQSSFMDVMKAVAESAKGNPGTAADPRIKTIFLGDSSWLSLTRTAYQQQQGGGIQIPAFHSLEHAIAYIHLEMEKEKSASGEANHSQKIDAV